MKYGAELIGRSVPEWRAQNILYDELKEKIKHVTSNDGDREAAKELEEQFYMEFETICQFVALKNSELDRRLAKCESEAANILPNSAQVEDPAAFFASPQAHQFQRDLSGLARDSQLLSRYVNAQFTGFRKLLKKYRKWSKNKSILRNFEKRLKGPQSFANIDFEKRFDKLLGLYNLARGNQCQSDHCVSQESQYQSSNAQHEPHVNSRIQFDTELLDDGNKTKQTYWVHRDRLVELKFRLLQNLSAFDDATNTRDSTNICFLKNGNDLLCLETTKMLSSSGRVIGKASGAIYQNKLTTLNEQLIKTLSAGQACPDPLPESLQNDKALCSAINESKYLLTVECVRSRFKKLDFTGTLVSLDENIKISSAPEFATEFPYSILTLVFPNNHEPTWLGELNQYRVIYSVPSSFSIEKFVEYRKTDTKCEEDLPTWMQQLNNGVDILALPTKTKTTETVQTPALSKNVSSNSLSLKAGPPDLIADGGDVSSPERARYWNEFDHPDEDNDDLAFAVMIDDEYELMRRAQQQRQISQPVLVLGKQVRRGLGRMRSYLGMENNGLLHPSRCNGEDQRSLMSTSDNRSVLSRQSSCDSFDHHSSSAGVGSFSPRILPRYGTADVEAQSLMKSERQSSRAVMLILLLALGMSSIIAMMSTALILGDGPSNLPSGVKAVAAVGFVFSLALSGLGTYCFYLKDDNSWHAEVAVNALQLALICISVGGIVFVSTS